MKRKSILSLCFIALIGCAAAAAHAASLTVALYPYVPRYDQFKTVIEQKWKAVEPNVPIVWVPKSQWDGGYGDTPSSSYDLYVFDAINLDYFRAKNWLLALKPSEVQHFDDFLSYAADGVKHGGMVYAIPQLGCGSILFYEKSDSALAKATTLDQVTAALGSCTYYGETPANDTGLMMDLSGGTTNACTYVESVHERLNEYPVPLPQTPSQADKKSVDAVRRVLATSSFKDAYYSGSNEYQRAAWFNTGAGRAYIGFTESMSQLSPQRLKQIAFKPMPWSNNAQGNRSPLFYSDVIGIEPATVGRGTRKYAVELANLMASTDVMVASIGAYDGKGPQYLMPVRHSVFKKLDANNATYKAMYDMVTGVTPILFNLGPNSTPWLKSMKSNVRSLFMADPACYTDVNAGPIMSNAAAQTICPRTCKNYGGWNGQWTTTVPGTMSVCGCNTPSS